MAETEATDEQEGDDETADADPRRDDPVPCRHR